MDAQEKYKEYQKGKEEVEASGVDALIRDVNKTTNNTVQGAKVALDHSINDVDDNVTDAIDHIGGDMKKTATDMKNNVKSDLGIGTNDKTSRFDKAAAGKDLTDGIKEPEKDDEIYVSRKQARYQ